MSRRFTYHRTAGTRHWRPLRVEKLESRRLLAGSLENEPQVVFELNYVGGNEIGFNDPIFGPTFRTALENVTNRLGLSLLHEAVIQMDVFSLPFDGKSVAKATSEISAVTAEGGFVDPIIPAKIKGLGDRNGNAADGRIEVLFFSESDTLRYETDPANVVPGEIDFQAVVLHELIHTLGWTSSTTATGSDDNGGGIDRPGTWRPYDRFLADVDGNRLIDANPDSATFLRMNVSASGWPSVSTGGKGPDAGLFFDGPIATAVYGGRVPLFSPATFSLESTASHLDSEGFPEEPSIFSPRQHLMSSAIISGPAPQGLTALERAVLVDTGLQLRDSIAVVAGGATLAKDGADIVVRDQSNETFRGNSNGLTSLYLVGGTSDDALELDITSGLIIPQGGLQFVGKGGEDAIVLNDTTNWRMGDPIVDDDKFFVSATNLLTNERIEADLRHAYRNFLIAGDVNNDGNVSSADALAIVFELNSPTVSDAVNGELQSPTVVDWPGLYFDRSGDDRVTALDALMVINDLFLQDFASDIEGEAIITDFIETKRPGQSDLDVWQYDAVAGL